MIIFDQFDIDFDQLGINFEHSLEMQNLLNHQERIGKAKKVQSEGKVEIKPKQSQKQESKTEAKQKERKKERKKEQVGAYQEQSKSKEGPKQKLRKAI